MSNEGSLEGVAAAVNERLDVAGDIVKSSVNLGAQVPADVVAEIAAVANRGSVVVDAASEGAAETVGDVVDKLIAYGKEITELIAKLPRLITG